MIRLRTYARPLGQMTIDPVTHTALTSAGAVLASSGDPGAQETASLLEQILVSPGVQMLRSAPVSGPDTGAKISDINPYLRGISGVMNHPYLSLVAVISIPALLFAIGRASK